MYFTQEFRSDLSEVAKLTGDTGLARLATLTKAPVPLGHLRDADPQKTRIVLGHRQHPRAPGGIPVERLIGPLAVRQPAPLGLPMAHGCRDGPLGCRSRHYFTDTGAGRESAVGAAALGP